MIYYNTYLGNCFASDGPGIGRDCVFPFTDNGITYHKCALSRPGEIPWCKTDKDEAFSDEYKSWGFCDVGCFATEGNLKFFVFHD